MRRLVAGTVALVLGAFVACRGSSATSGSKPSGSSDAGPLDAGAWLTLTNPCTDATSAVYATPASLTAPQGTVLACAPAPAQTAAQVQTGLVTSGVTDAGPSSGAIEYLIQYATQRATNPLTPGYASAAVFYPATPRSTKLPVITIAHPTAGESLPCAESVTKDLDATDDMYPLIFSLVGEGFAVIVSDGAGYAGYGAPGNPPMSFLFSQDEAMGVLDAARALRALSPTIFTDSVVIVGYSQGGHSALSALAQEEAYGAGGTIVGVVAYSPIWFNQGTWGAIFFEAADYLLSDPGSLGAIKFDVWYHYTHGAVLDGPDGGLGVFAPSAQAAVSSFINNECDPDGDAGALTSLPGTIADLYDSTFVNAVEKHEALGQPCPTDPVGGPLCTTWSDRYAADRPHITGSATSIPTLLVRGGEDNVVPMNRFTCGTDRLSSDGVSYSVCYDPTADHGGTLRQSGAYVSQWIAHLTLGGPDPGACALGLDDIVDDAGAPIACATPPSNN